MSVEATQLETVRIGFKMAIQKIVTVAVLG